MLIVNIKVSSSQTVVEEGVVLVPKGEELTVRFTVKLTKVASLSHPEAEVSVT